MLGRQHVKYVCIGSDYIGRNVWTSRILLVATMMYVIHLSTVSRMYTEIHGKHLNNTVFALKSGQKGPPDPAGRHGRHGYFFGPPCRLAFFPRGCTKTAPGDMGDMGTSIILKGNMVSCRPLRVVHFSGKRGLRSEGLLPQLIVWGGRGVLVAW